MGLHPSQLARDADQLALIVDLKCLADIGYAPPHKWLAHVRQRLQTEAARQLADTVMATDHDDWWLRLFAAKTEQVGPGSEQTGQSREPR
jgi:putative hydrolase of HD superfamily